MTALLLSYLSVAAEAKPANVAIAMWYDGNVASYGDVAANINKQFASRHNWTLYQSNETFQSDRDASWEKIPLLLKLVDQGKHDTILWLDSDAAVQVRQQTPD